jgi:hypothetical protein
MVAALLSLQIFIAILSYFFYIFPVQTLQDQFAIFRSCICHFKFRDRSSATLSFYCCLLPFIDILPFIVTLISVRYIPGSSLSLSREFPVQRLVEIPL